MGNDKPFGQAAFIRHEGKWKLARKESSLICDVKHCRRPRRPTGNLCFQCHNREWRANHPVQYAFHNLKRHAAQRGIRFTLTMEQFETFVNGNDYMNGKGRQPQDLSIDRIECSKGYELGNLQILTKSENSIKRNQEYGSKDEQDTLPF